MKLGLYTEKGFSYIQLVVAIAIGGIVVFGLAQALNLASQSLKGVETSNEVALLYSELAAATSNSTVCTNNLDSSNPNSSNQSVLPANFGALPPNVPIDLVALQYFDDNNPAQAVSDLIRVGVRKNGLTVDSIQFIPKVRVAQNQLVADLQLTISKGGRGIGPGKVKRIVPLFLTLDSAGLRVVECNSKLDNAGGGFYDKVCEIASGGRQEYDEASKSCVDRFPKNCVQNPNPTDRPYFAQCPGTQVPIPGFAACIAKPPGGFADASTAERTYKSGVVRVPPPAVGLVDRASRSCSCDYAVGIDSTGWVCEICCETTDD